MQPTLDKLLLLLVNRFQNRQNESLPAGAPKYETGGISKRIKLWNADLQQHYMQQTLAGGAILAGIRVAGQLTSTREIPRLQISELILYGLPRMRSGYKLQVQKNASYV